MLLEISTQQLFNIGIPVVGLLILFVFSIKEYFSKKNKGLGDHLFELKKNAQNQTLPLRLAAYERLTLLIERITPASLFIRVSPQGLTATDMQAVCLNEIRNEFEHNLSQQVYVSEAAWQAVKKTKDETILLINTIASSMPANTTAFELSRAVLEHVSKMPSDPYAQTNSLLRAEVSKLY
ncbi:hypothetical protein [Solitalea lacus]|uniref:DUF7935 family protein n=1 Tax=Solitalea lacus TaxID=2911172 RepID=UPI001ED9CB0C|nr:hypothetical protein [Solitalea lacus]UKJ08424.1 hypothetical protein L2B55_04440 [Solitalea lacus]